MRDASRREQDRYLMTDAENPFSDLDLQQAIDLRWTLRDIRAKRWKLSRSTYPIWKNW
jgi:hypothetical protein